MSIKRFRDLALAALLVIAFFEDFEYLASRAKAWIEKHPRGDYPDVARRLLPTND
jgi:hypothetical protein